MRRRLGVTQEALDEQTAPAAMEPPCPTVSNADIKTVGGVWHSSLLYDFRIILPTVCYVALKEFAVCFEMIVCISYTKNLKKEFFFVLEQNKKGNEMLVKESII